MVREKTRLELLEELKNGPHGAADRLRGALFALTKLDDIEEIRRVAWAALKGELHGHEPKPAAEPDLVTSHRVLV